jgi:uncharacterized protein (TIGR02246 family)
METYKEGRQQEEMNIQEVARKNIVLWGEALLSKDPQKVAELYAEDNTFLPTMSPDFKKGVDEAEGYFKHFLEKNPEVKIMEDAVQSLSEDSYLHSGMYDFKVKDSGNEEVVSARFSFVWRKESDGEWKIIHHHSSVKPQ